MFRFIGACGLIVVAMTALIACSHEATEPPPPTTTTVAPGPTTGRVQITGTVSALAADRAVTDPIAPPFTITVAQRGVGGGEFDGVLVDGKPNQINWQAGQPLPVRGPGAGVNLNEARVKVDATAITWSLDGAGRELLPGTYMLGSSVAVGAGGIATPMDSVTFTAVSNSLLSTRGDARIVLKPMRLRLEGNQGTLDISGRLTVATATGQRRVTHAVFGPGSYRITLTPDARGWRIDADLDGTLTA